MVREVVTLEGDLIDSNLLGRVLHDVVSFGAEYTILETEIGQERGEKSTAKIEIRTDTIEKMNELLGVLNRHGAVWHAAQDVQLMEADMDGALPMEFYSSTNQQTYIRYNGKWHEVRDQEMDCGVVYEPGTDSFRCVPVNHIKQGMPIVCGTGGVKVIPFERQRAKGVFEFMASDISTEKPKYTIIRNCAELMIQSRREGRKLLLVGGPAIVHTGAVDHVVNLIQRGFFNVLFAGNALATHDIEHALLGTSLGVYIDKATLADAGHEHHLRAINTIRRCGGIRQAVDQDVLTSGIMHACVKNNVHYVLAGSVRDDGPLPDVVTDMELAQDLMRQGIKDVGFVLMVATGLHSIATGNILPAWVPAVCVDISPSILTKLADRGSFQTIGLVTDVEPFFRSLVHAIDELEETKEAAAAG